jgi:hypothetical protein
MFPNMSVSAPESSSICSTSLGRRVCIEVTSKPYISVTANHWPTIDYDQSLSTFATRIENTLFKVVVFYACQLSVLTKRDVHKHAGYNTA